jgi:valyl-tRNA synthetase
VRREGIETMFAIEQPFRSEEEARGWCPYIQTGVSEPEVEQTEMDRQTRYLHVTIERHAGKCATRIREDGDRYTWKHPTRRP